MSGFRDISRFVLPALLAALAIGCTSRYRLNLYLVQDESRRKVKVESTQYITDAILGSPYERDRVVRGRGNCIVLTTGSRGEEVKTTSTDIIAWDRYVRFEVYLQLPPKPAPGTIPLKNNSFVHLLGRYEKPTEEKVFLAQSGNLVIDSLSHEHLFGTIDGQFENAKDETVGFQGRFKVKYTD
jgi:hypothetical protein